MTSGGVAGDGMVRSALLSAQVQTGIVLNTEVQEAQAWVAGPGDIRLTEAGAIVLHDLVAANGCVDVIAGGSITALNVVSQTDSEGNDVILTSQGGDVLVDLIRVGRWHGAVTMEASGDIREIDAFDSYVDVIGNRAELTASGEIGSASNPDLNLEMNLTQSADENDLVDYVIGDLELNADVVGSVFITATGTITVTHLTSGAGEINLLSTDGDIRVDYLDAGAGEIALAAPNGSIYEAVESDEESDLVAADLRLSAYGNIAGGSDLNPYLEIEVETLDAEALQGSIYLQETDDLEVGVVSAPAGDVDIRSGGLLRSQTGTISAGQVIRLHASALTFENIPISAAGEIVLQASDGAVWAGGDTLITTGWLAVEARTGITLNTQADELVAHNPSAGDIRITEVDDIVLRELSAADGMIEVRAGKTITAYRAEVAADAAGNGISLTTTDGDILVGALVVGRTCSSVLLEAPNGFILETTPPDPEADVVGYFGRLNSLPTTGLPIDPELSLEFDLVVLRNSATDLVLDIVGDIELNTELMGIADVTATGTITVIYLATTGGSITLHAGADILIDYLDAGAEGEIHLTAGGSILEVSDSDPDVDLIGGAAILSAGNALGTALQAALALETSLTTLEAQTGTGPILFTETDDIELAGLQAAASDVKVMSGGTITVAGDIVAANRIDLQAAQAIHSAAGAGVIAQQLEVVAGAGIDLNTGVQNATLQVTGAGDLKIVEVDAITLSDISIPNGSVEISAGGPLTIHQVESLADAEDNDIALTTTSGALEVNSIAAGVLGDVLLKSAAGLTATVAGDELAVQAGGPITLHTTVASLDVVTLAAGNVTIIEADTIVLNSILIADGAFSVTAGGAVTAGHVESLTDAEGNDISLATTAGGMTVDELRVGALGDVELIASGGLAATVQADELLARADGPMNLTTTVNRLDAETGAAGGITVIETDDVTLTNVRSFDGSISVTAGAVLVGFVQSLTDGDANDIALTATGGNIEAGWIVAGAQGDVTLASTGTIADGGGKIVADVLVLESSGPIAVNTTVNVLTATHEGSLTVAETDEITLTTAIASLTLTTEESGDVAVSEADDLTLLDVRVADGAFSVSGGGIVIGGQISAREVVFLADHLVSLPGSLLSAEILDATVLFGMTLETDVDFLAAQVTDAGDIEITQMDAVTLDRVETFDGSVSITAGGAITAASVESLTDSEENDIALITTDSDMVATEIRAGQLGDVRLESAGALTATVWADELFARAAGTMTLVTTVRVLDAQTSATGNLVVAETDGITLTNVRTLDGSIAVTAAGGIAAALIESLTDADVNDITLTTTGGAIQVAGMDAGGRGDVLLTAAGPLNATVAADELAATAAGDITLFTAVNALAAETSAAGIVTVVEVDAITLRHVQAVDGAISVTAGDTIIALDVAAQVDAEGNDICLTATGGHILIDCVGAGRSRGDIHLASAGDIREVDLFDPDVDVRGRYAYVQVAGEFGSAADPNLELELDVGTLEFDGVDLILHQQGDLELIAAVPGVVDVHTAGSITATCLVSGQGEITLTAGADILVDYADAGAQTGVVCLTAAGSIYEAEPSDDTIDLIAQEACLRAGSHIGGGSEGNLYLETEVGTLIAEVAGSTIYIQETDDLVLASVVAPNGDIGVVAGGDIVVTGVVTTGTVAGTISLRAGGRIDMEGDDPVATGLLKATANSGIFLRTQTAALEARVEGEGLLEIRETDSLVLTNVTNVDGAIRVMAGGSITAMRVESLVDEKGNNIGIMTFSGDILVDYVGVGSEHGQISLSSAGAIRELGAGDPGVDLEGALGILYAQGKIDKGLDGSFQPVHRNGQQYALYEFERGEKLNLCYLDGDVEIFLSLQNKVHIFATGTIRVVYLDSHGQDIYLRSKYESILVEYLNPGPRKGDVKLKAGDFILPPG
jgi:hypothetical protein